MKKNNAGMLSTFFFFMILFATGCQKEAAKINDNVVEQSIAAKSESGGDARLTLYDYYDVSGDLHQIDSYSYKNGLVDEWLTFYGSLFKMEYDENRVLKIARVYNGGTLYNTVQFLYKKDKVVKEIWYEGSTQVVVDEVLYTYNQKGEMIRNESTGFDYYAVNTYNNGGDLTSWHYFYAGLPVAKGEYTYNDQFKNPYKALPGIEYNFPYVNAAFLSSKKWPSGEKITFYDEIGNPVIYYDQDPLQTLWLRGPQNYPFQTRYIDKISGGQVTNTFEYENCTGCIDSNTGSKIAVAQKKGINNNSKAPSLKFKFLKQGYR